MASCEVSTTVHTSHLRSKPYFRYSIPGMEFHYRNLDPGTELLHGVWLRCSSDPCFGPFVRSETGTLKLAPEPELKH